MKKKKIKVWYMIMVVTMFAITACGSNEESGMNEPPLNNPEQEPTLQVTAFIGKGESKTRTATDVTDPYNTNPDFSKGENFRWVNGDNVCALFNATGATTYQAVANIKATDIEGNKASFNISANNLPKAGTCRMFHPSKGINMGYQGGPTIVNIEIPSAMQKSNFANYISMYSDPFDYDLTESGTTTVTPKISFHHLCALLRFNLWNQTGTPYTVKNITIRYTDFNAFRRRLTFTLTNPTAPVYYDNYNYNKYMQWNNDTYLADPGIVDDKSTPDKNESVYDALMVLYPTTPQASGVFTISIVLYDTETKLDFPLQTVTLNSADHAFLRDTGFQKGTRTYFCIDILKGGRTQLRDVKVTPWEGDEDLGNGDVELPSYE